MDSRLGKHAVVELVEDLDIGHLIFHGLLLVLVDLSLGSVFQAGKEQPLSRHFLGIAARSDECSRRGLPLWILVFERLEQSWIRVALPKGNGCECRSHFSSDRLDGSRREV